MKITLVTSELTPIAQTGGLGDMIASMAKALKRMGHDVLIVLPKYRCVRDSGFSRLPLSLKVGLGTREVGVDVWTGETPEGVGLCLVDIPEFFDRPELYGEDGKDYPDNSSRFIAFSKATPVILKALRHASDIVHAHDWHAALTPLYIKTLHAQDGFFRETRTVLTLHNLAHQGVYPAADFSLTGLPPSCFSMSCLEFYGQVNFLKGGIISADALTTVSPSYAREVMTAEYGCGLEGVLRERQEVFTGIQNGIDVDVWNPRTDPHLKPHFSTARLGGKRECKRLLQEEVGLPEDLKTPLIGMIARWVPQKGIDVIPDVVTALGGEDLQWVFLGNGEEKWGNALRELTVRFPRKVAVADDFDIALAHRIEAGADFFFMPSRYEPCGYNQQYSQRYGTIPIVRATGGLRDTVIDGETGFVFQSLEVPEMVAAIRRAVELYREVKRRRDMQKHMMGLDLSWDRSARRYLDIYQKLLTQNSST